ncbi:hypothetical protein E2C01_058564 [Portunus trituberculatus]|uniref:Uncharacterized protein n=1 Tax=Portunus trituberculatus TaxID=210409 RepID=A0A5B7H5Q9_PORTR|nr:hypothetical protein [Portunus trituberculatus]
MLSGVARRSNSSREM